MKKFIIPLILLFLNPLQAISFKDIFLHGEKGDFSIYQNGASVTILSIHSKELPFITFEEITLPKRIYENVKGRDLNGWIKKGCPGNTSWTVMEIDTNSLSVTSAYCFLKRTHLDIRKEDALISSLLSLELKETPEEERPKIGPRGNSKKDTRETWIPSMIFNGEKRKPSIVDVYKSTWQKDLSALSGRDIDLYILNKFPFPYWIQIHGELGSKKMVSLDSGSNLVSAISDIPKLPPKFLSKLEKWDSDSSFSFLLESNRSFTGFIVYVLEVSSKESKLFPLQASFQRMDTGVYKFNIAKSLLDKELTKGQKYRLYLSYEDGSEIKSIVSKDIIHWK